VILKPEKSKGFLSFSEFEIEPKADPPFVNKLALLEFYSTDKVFYSVLIVLIDSPAFDSSTFVFYPFCLGAPNIPLLAKLPPKLAPRPKPPNGLVLAGLV